MLKNTKKRKLDFKCDKCKRRFSIDELIEEGYAEKCGSEGIQVECPNCDNNVFLRK